MLESPAFEHVETTLEDISIRPAQQDDLDAIWDIFHFHLAAGETYPFEAHTPKSACEDYWLGPNVDSFVAVRPGRPRARHVPHPAEPGRAAARTSPTPPTWSATRRKAKGSAT